MAGRSIRKVRSRMLLELSLICLCLLAAAAAIVRQGHYYSLPAMKSHSSKAVVAAAVQVDEIDDRQSRNRDEIHRTSQIFSSLSVIYGGPAGGCCCCWCCWG